MSVRFMRIYLICCAAILSACAVGPDYARPDTAKLETYKEETPINQENASKWRLATPGTLDAGPWWASFGDPTLNELMEELGKANQNVQVSMANLRQARAQVREARAAFFPVVGANSSVIRGNTVTNKATANTYTAQLQASWDLDIWGGTRRSVESSEAQAKAQAANLGTVILSMRGELATNYFQLRTSDILISLYADTVKALTRTLQITENQYKAGVATQADVAQALAQLKSTNAQAVDLQIQRKQTEHAIATLLGRTPSEFSLPPAPFAAQLPNIDTGLPSTLLERRPDVAAAEQQVVAANASIGVAKSAYFPVFSFSTAGGYVNNAFSEWFTSPNQIWSLGPSLALTLFQGGALIAKTDQATAAWEGAIANYRQIVLQAVNEVEDNLASMRFLKEEEALQKEALKASQKAEAIILNQYKAGTVTFVNVVVAQTATLSNARTVAQLQGSRYATTVSLILALGGGWDNTQLAATGETLPDAPASSAVTP